MTLRNPEHRRPAAACLAAAIVVLLVTGRSASVGAAPPAQEELPCDVTYDRTVAPGTIAVNESVHVRITVNGTCPQGSRGLDVFFVVDRSVTMFDKSYMNPTKDALQNFVNAMDFTKSMAGLITYAANEQVNQPLTTNRDSVLQAIDRIRLNEENDVRALPDAFRTATQLLDRDGIQGNDKIILIVAAGPDVDGALVNMPTVTQAARNAGVKVIFLMFPDSRYLHYVEASSDCTGSHCQSWSSRAGVIVKWAWGVDANTIDSILSGLVPILARSLGITSVAVEDYLHSGAVLVPGSVQPPQSAGSDRVLIWSRTDIPAGGMVLEYDARMIYEDETYPVTDVTELAITYSDGSPAYRRDLPNPDITVLSELPTNTPGTPDPTDTPPPDPTDTPTATATDTQTNGAVIYLPLALLGEL